MKTSNWGGDWDCLAFLDSYILHAGCNVAYRVDLIVQRTGLDEAVELVQQIQLESRQGGGVDKPRTWMVLMNSL